MRRGNERGPDRGLGLAELQRWFLDCIVAPHRTTQTAQPATAGRAASEVIRPAGALSPDQRMAIYSRMYFVRLRIALAQEYGTVEQLMGKDAFTELARGYLEHHPSRSYTLNDLGHALPRYIQEHCDRSDAALLHDVARLERAIADALDSHALGTVTASDLAGIPAEAWAGLRLRMDPSVRILAFAHDACALVAAHREGKPLPEVAPGPAWAVVWRRDHVVWRRPLSQAMHAILSALAAGAYLGEALAAAAAVWDGDDAELESKVFEWFADWLSEGYFRALVRG